MELAQSFPREKVINTMWFLNWEFRLNNNDDDDDDRMMMNRVGKKSNKIYFRYKFYFCFLFFSFFFLLKYIFTAILFVSQWIRNWMKMCIRNKKWILIIEEEKIISSFVHWMMKRMKEKMYKTLIFSRFINEVKRLLDRMRFYGCFGSFFAVFLWEWWD